jgi:hypothetical protein
MHQQRAECIYHNDMHYAVLLFFVVYCLLFGSKIQVPTRLPPTMDYSTMSNLSRAITQHVIPTLGALWKVQRTGTLELVQVVKLHTHFSFFPFLYCFLLCLTLCLQVCAVVCDTLHDIGRCCPCRGTDGLCSKLRPVLDSASQRP